MHWEATFSVAFSHLFPLLLSSFETESYCISLTVSVGTQLTPRSDPGASAELTSACHTSWLTGNKLLQKTYPELRHT